MKLWKIFLPGLPNVSDSNGQNRALSFLSSGALSPGSKTSQPKDCTSSQGPKGNMDFKASFGEACCHWSIFHCEPSALLGPPLETWVKFFYVIPWAIFGFWYCCCDAHWGEIFHSTPDSSIFQTGPQEASARWDGSSQPASACFPSARRGPMMSSQHSEWPSCIQRRFTCSDMKIWWRNQVSTKDNQKEKKSNKTRKANAKPKVCRSRKSSQN